MKKWFLLFVALIFGLVSCKSTSPPEPAYVEQINLNGEAYRISWDSDCQILNVRKEGISDWGQHQPLPVTRFTSQYCGDVTLLAEGASCKDDLKCASMYCNPDGICSHPNCTDGWWNDLETGIDCGGFCEPCDGEDQVDVVGDILISDREGIVQLHNQQGAEITLAIQDSAGSAISGASVASATDAEGVLVLVVPPAGSNYVPAYSYIENSQGEAAAAKLAAPAGQMLVTVHLDTSDEATVPSLTEVPRSPLEDLWESPGWHSFVTNTHEFCESVSILSGHYHVAEVSYDVSKAYIFGAGLKTLGKKLFTGVLGGFAGLEEGFIELCLAATGDPLGLKDLTGVVNDSLDYHLLLLDEPPPTVVAGLTLDEQTGEALPGVEITSPTQSTRSNSSGLYIISTNFAYGYAMTYERDGYASEIIELEIPEEGYLNQGEISMPPLGDTALQNFKEALKQAIESGDLRAMEQMMGLPSAPDFDFWYAIYMYEGFPSTKEETIANLRDWDYSQVRVDISSRAEAVYDDLVDPKPTFSGSMVLAEGWGFDGEDRFLLEITEEGGEFFWSGMLLFSNERTPFGPVPPPKSEWNFFDLDQFLLLLEWGVKARNYEALRELVSDPFYEYHCATMCKDSFPRSTGEVEEVFGAYYDALDSIPPSEGVIYWSSDTLHTCNPIEPMAERGLSSTFYCLGEYPVLIFGLSQEGGRYYLSDVVLIIQ